LIGFLDEQKSSPYLKRQRNANTHGMKEKQIIQLAYYPGCSLHASSQLYDIQCKLVFDRLGIELREIEDWNCCGAAAASKTNDFLALALPARNLGIVDAMGLAEIVIPCSSCYSRTLVAQKTLSSDPLLMSSINENLTHKIGGSIRVSNILEVFTRAVGTGILVEKAFKKLTGLRPACYYGCLLTRFPCDVDINDDVENPQTMEMLCKTLSAEPIDWNYKTDCCGASGAFTDAEQAQLLISRIVQDAVARDANCIVTSCPLCQFNVDVYQDKVRKKYRIGKKLPVYFITELLGLAMGIDAEEMQVNRHFVDAMGLLRELKLL
jgi:heterodisulfide reductase subunit B2